MRRLLLAAVLLVTIPSSPAFASSITINWTGSSLGFYNGDWLSLCKSSGVGCEYWDAMQEASGFDLESFLQTGVSKTPWRLSITLYDGVPDAYGYFNTTADIHLEVGKLGIVSRNRPVWLGSHAAGQLTPPGYDFGLATSLDNSPLAGILRPGPFQTVVAMPFVGNMSPGTSLVARLQQQPLSALQMHTCISVGDDCDFVAYSETVSVSVPEPSTLISLSGGAALLAFGFLGRRRNFGNQKSSQS